MVGLGTWVVRNGDGVVGVGGCSLRGDGAFWNLGYRLAFGVHGKGYATSIARSAVEAAHSENRDVPVVAYLLEHNAASARVAEKAGLSLVHRAPDARNPDPAAIRLVYADRELSQTELTAALS